MSGTPPYPPLRPSEQPTHSTDSIFRAIVESSDDAIISMSLEGIITSWNRAAEELFGYTAPEMVHQSILMLVPPDRIDEEPKILDQIRRGQRLDHYETIRRHKSGALIDISLTVSPIIVEKGEIIGASKIARNITERKQSDRALQTTADELRQVRDELKAADLKKNEFLALLAHELRNPLAPLRNGVRILRSNPDAGMTEEVYSMMERQLGQMVRFVDDLLDISRISRGKVELRRSKVDLACAISHALDSIKAHAACMSHSLKINLPEEPIFINADPARISQIISNLLNNSCKFTANGGLISLDVEWQPHHVTIRIKDNGIGISPDNLTDIFGMFTQVDTSIERTKSGLGIGLALSKSLVELHGGTIEAHSQGLGHGTEFLIRLPKLAELVPTSSQPASRNEIAKVEGQRILIVDDNVDAARSLSMFLRLKGNELRTANDGIEALGVADEFRPQVIFLDIGLPKLNGYAVAQKIREQSWGKATLLVALTGWGQEEDRRKTSEAGFNAHLIKPADLTEIESLLEEHSKSR